MGAQLSDVVIAGVNKAGTTSLFVSLSRHPEIAPSAVKETRYFLPARYNKPLEPFSVYEQYFDLAPTQRVRLEATPSLLYGGAAVATVMSELLSDPRIVVVLREPVSRAISFFQYQKIRLRLPPELTFEDYMRAVDALPDDAFLDPDNEKYMAFRGGCYADFLPAWWDVFGTDRLSIVWFDELVRDPEAVVESVTSCLGLDPMRRSVERSSSENRTTGYRNRRLQRVALKSNDRFERVLRRHPAIKRKLRALYYKLNAQPLEEDVPAPVREALTARYREPNARLVAQLREVGLHLPAWLTPEPRATERA